jgi:hypothetical protein
MIYFIHLRMGNHTRMQYLTEEAQANSVAFDASGWKSSVEEAPQQLNW